MLHRLFSNKKMMTLPNKELYIDLWLSQATELFADLHMRKTHWYIWFSRTNRSLFFLCLFLQPYHLRPKISRNVIRMISSPRLKMLFNLMLNLNLIFKNNMAATLSNSYTVRNFRNVTRIYRKHSWLIWVFNCFL